MKEQELYQSSWGAKSGRGRPWPNLSAKPPNALHVVQQRTDKEYKNKKQNGVIIVHPFKCYHGHGSSCIYICTWQPGIQLHVVFFQIKYIW